MTPEIANRLRAFWADRLDSLKNTAELAQFVADELALAATGSKNKQVLLSDSLGPGKYKLYVEYVQAWLLVKHNRGGNENHETILKDARARSLDGGLKPFELSSAQERGNGILSRWLEDELKKLPLSVCFKHKANDPNTFLKDGSHRHD